MMTAEVALTYRPAGPADEPFLLLVYAASRTAELAALPWSAEQRAAFVSFQATAQREHYASRFPDADHAILVVEGASAGRLWVDKGAEEVRILDLVLHPEHAGSPAAALALADLAAESDRRALPIRARLDPADPLLGTYLDFGFVETEADGPTPLYERLPSPNP